MGNEGYCQYARVIRDLLGLLLCNAPLAVEKGTVIEIVLFGILR